jgi:hypothetical protein
LEAQIERERSDLTGLRNNNQQQFFGIREEHMETEEN